MSIVLMICKTLSLGMLVLLCLLIFCNDHDWGDSSYDLVNLFKPHDEYVCNIIEIRSGEVMTLVDFNTTILEDYKILMHVDREEKVLYDIYIVEFDYDPTCNDYERGKYGCRNFHVTKLPLVMLRLLMFYSSSLQMLDVSCLDNLFAYKNPIHRKYVRLKCVYHMFYYALFVFQLLSFM